MNKASRILIYFFFPVLVVCMSSAQPPAIQWDSTFQGEGGINYANDVCETFDGGFVLTGQIVLNPEDDPQMVLIKADSAGNQVWSRTFTGTGFHGGAGYSVVETDEHGFLIAGTVDQAGFTFAVVKADSTGAEEWRRGYDNSSHAIKIRQTSDGGFIATGGDFNVTLLKGDEQGNEVWRQDLGGFDTNIGRDVHQTSDGGYIILAYTDGYGQGYKLIKTDSLGVEEWSQVYGTPGTEIPASMLITNDGDYVLCGYGWNGDDDYDILLIKTDSAGNTLWSRYLGGAYGQIAGDIDHTETGGYIICGYEWNGALVLKTDADGNELWTETYFDGGSAEGHGIKQVSDGGYIIAGATNAWGYSSSDILLMRLDNEPLVSISLQPHDLPIQIPAAGGSFTFDAMSLNTFTESMSGQAWTVVELPSGRDYIGPELYRTRLMFEPGIRIDRTDIEQVVPAFAPAGTYVYKARVGFYPDVIYAQDSFEFEKLTNESR